MIVYTYDGSFEGFLTCIYEAYYNKWPYSVSTKDSYILNLLEEEIYIETNTIKSSKVKDAIINKLSNLTLKTIYTVFLSCEKDKDKKLLIYIGLLFKVGISINNYKQNSTVIYVDKIYKRVESEAHRFTGFIRFKDIGGCLYSKIEPDNNILELIANHFIDRFSSEKFIIHDGIRNRALVHNGRINHIVEDFSVNELVCKNDDYEELWKTYFKSTNIKERKNLAHQRGMMPRRYWKNMIEVEK